MATRKKAGFVMEENITQITAVEAAKPEPPPPLQRVEVPQSVAAVLNQIKAEELTRQIAQVREAYREGRLSHDDIESFINAGIIERPANIFQQLQDYGMQKFVEMIVGYLRQNMRTTMIGITFLLTEAIAKFGLNISSDTVNAIAAIGYAIIFKFSDVRWDLATVVGVILMVASFFVSPIVASLGIAIDAGTMGFISMALQQGVATLLKDQKALFEPQPQSAE